MAENKKISEIMKIISDEEREVSVYERHLGNTSLINLTEKQARIAVYLDAPIGILGKELDYRDLKNGDYVFYRVDSIECLNDYLKDNRLENRATIYPYVPDHKKILGYIEQVEEMNLSEHELKAASGYGLKQLRQLAERIENATDGKQQVSESCLGGVYIKQDESVTIGLHMRENVDFTTSLLHLEFQGYVRRMGVHMSVDGIKEIAMEAEQIVKLITELEQEPIIVSEEEMTQWTKEIAAAQFEQAITDAAEQDPQLEPRMGMM